MSKAAGLRRRDGFLQRVSARAGGVCVTTSVAIVEVNGYEIKPDANLIGVDLDLKWRGRTVKAATARRVRKDLDV